MAAKTRTTLYRMYSSAGVLLYVGISSRWSERLSQHRQIKPWHFRVNIIKLTHFPTREAALLAESEVIRLDRPRYNIAQAAGRPVRSRPRPRTQPPSDADILTLYSSGALVPGGSPPMEEVRLEAARSRARWERLYGPIEKTRQPR